MGPEVLRCALGSAQGYPQLIVLDSTVPAVVQGVSDAIDPANTLFLVSSKSGSTIEPNCLYAISGGWSIARVVSGQATTSSPSPTQALCWSGWLLMLGSAGPS